MYLKLYIYMNIFFEVFPTFCLEERAEFQGIQTVS